MVESSKKPISLFHHRTVTMNVMLLLTLQRVSLEKRGWLPVVNILNYKEAAAAVSANGNWAIVMVGS